MRFELFGELQTFAEVLDRFVDRESGPIGRDFKQDPARLTKIDGVKIFAIDHRRDGKAKIDKFLAPLQLLFIIRRAKCDVMHRSGRNMPNRVIRSFDEIDLRTQG